MATLFYMPYRPAFDSNAKFIPGAQAWFTLEGTNTPSAIYTDIGMTTPQTNPIVANAVGRFPVTYLNPAVSYRVRVYDEDAVVGVDTPLEDYDPYVGIENTLGFVQAGTGAVNRDLQGKMRDIVAVPDFSSHAVADATDQPLFVPADVTSTVANAAAVVSPLWGLGQVETADNNKLAKFYTNVTTAPVTYGNSDDIETAFNGDLTRSLFQIGARISGASTLGTPATGYLYTEEVVPVYVLLHNESGHNEGTASNVGRTGMPAFRADVKQHGQGDAVGFNASVFALGTKAGSTHFLANPAGVLYNGDFNAGADGVYANLTEFIAHDNGKDIACIGNVLNLDRTVATGAKSAFWSGYRVQSIGSASINNILNAVGKFGTGIDLSMPTLDFGANKAAISLKGDDRLYFNNSSSNEYYTTAFNGWYITYSVGIAALNVIANGASVMQISANKTAFIKPPQLPVVATAGLPAANAGNAGMEYYVNDANATTRLSVPVGGGTNFVKVFSNGTTWVIQ